MRASATISHAGDAVSGSIVLSSCIVPAVWSDAAKNSTLQVNSSLKYSKSVSDHFLQAAKIAGFFPVTLIKEPEAAALHTLYDVDFSCRVGDAYVICDAGGGTVDLISYEVEAISPHLKLRELVPGTGSMGGSLGLNKRFEEAVKDLIGKDKFSRFKKTHGWLRAYTQFDREIKPAFGGKVSEEYFVNFPMARLKDDRVNGLQANCWKMSGLVRAQNSLHEGIYDRIYDRDVLNP